MRLAFFGPPGGGKGTQADLVKDDAHAVQVATGDLLRAAVKDQTPVGKRAQEFMGRGSLVPVEIVNEILRERVVQTDAREGYILDGYPRTIGQLCSLTALLSELKMPVERWLFIDVPFAAIEERVLGRRTCKSCQASYDLKFNPSPKGDRCGKCDGELYQRPDDSAEKLRTRLDAYTKDTLPVVHLLKNLGLLVTIEAGTKKVDEVAVLVRKALGLPGRR